MIARLNQDIIKIIGISVVVSTQTGKLDASVINSGISGEMRNFNGKEINIKIWNDKIKKWLEMWILGQWIKE